MTAGRIMRNAAGIDTAAIVNAARVIDAIRTAGGIRWRPSAPVRSSAGRLPMTATPARATKAASIRAISTGAMRAIARIANMTTRTSPITGRAASAFRPIIEATFRAAFGPPDPLKVADAVHRFLTTP